MKVILTQDVEKVGSMGDLIDVADGFGRNFLLPRKCAVLATANNLKHLEHQKRLVATQVERERRAAQKLASDLDGVSVTITSEAGEGGKLFGSVTAKDVEEALRAQGHEVARKAIQLDRPIKNLGKFVLDVKLHRDVVSKVTVWVITREEATQPAT
jgi:large subunit ribosomal protein L9